MRTTYAFLWLAWITAFAAIEFTALGTGHPDDTLSWFTWRAEQLGPAWTFFRFFLAAFLVWLSLHLVFGWFR